MVLKIQLFLCVHVIPESKVMNTSSCVVIFILRLELFANLNKINSSFFKLSAKDQVNILLYSHSSDNPIYLSQDIIKLVINFLINSGCFDKLIIRFN